MRIARLIAVGLVIVAAGTVARAEEKKNADTAKLLVGKWTAEKGDTLNEGATLNLTTDGKVRLDYEQEGEKKVLKGTYKVGDKPGTIIITWKIGDDEKPETVKIKKLTEKELVIVDENSKTDTLKKK